MVTKARVLRSSILIGLEIVEVIWRKYLERETIESLSFTRSLAHCIFKERRLSIKIEQP
jgi:hypothetical protein